VSSTSATGSSYTIFHLKSSILKNPLLSKNLQSMIQNHRMAGVGRDLWGSPSHTPCQSRVTQSRLHRTASRRSLNISREGDFPTPLGSL